MINRNNYEEYMLLYIDGELSSSERNAVETFLEANPDLKEELELLQQAVLQPEEGIMFSGKDMLYRKEEGINLSNYQQYFLLYVDEELNVAEKEGVETFVLQHPELQDEFTVLKQTVLPKETIVFVNKEVLYRKEEKRRPVVISLRWASLAAAVMIGVMAMLWIVNNGNKTEGGVDPLAGKAENKIQPTITTPITQPEKSLENQSTNNQSLAVDTKEIKNVNVGTTVKQDQQKQNAPQEQLAFNTPKTNDPVIEHPVNNNQNSINTNNSGNAIAYTGVSDNDNDNGRKVTTVSTPDVASENYVKPAVYTEELNTDDEKHKSLYVGSLEVNTDKVRGFFRKAGRFLSSKIKNEDGDKVQVANLEVNKLK